MALNDSRDKLSVARDYLLEYPANSQEFEAALEHLNWLKDAHPDLRPAIASVVKEVIQRRLDEDHTMKKIGQAFK
jgi:hypothetical protein